MKEIDWNNREQVKERLSNSGWDILDAPTEIQEDREMVLIAATQNEFVLNHLSENFRTDYNFMLELVGRNGNALSKFEPKENITKDMAVAATRSSVLAMDVLPKELKNDPDIVMPALEKSINGLKYKFEEIDFYKNQKDKFYHISVSLRRVLGDATELRENDEYKGQITEKYIPIIKQYSPEALENPESMLYMIKYFGSDAINHASEKLISNPEFMLQAIQENSSVKDTAIVQKLINENPEFAKQVKVAELEQEKGRINEEIEKLQEQERDGKQADEIGDN